MLYTHPACTTNLLFNAYAFLILVILYITSVWFESTFRFLGRNLLHVLFELGLKIQCC